MKLRFSPRAIANLVDIADYFHERNPVAGRRVRSDIYAALDRASGAQQVQDAGNLATRMTAWLQDAAARETVAEAAHKTVDALCGALDRTRSALDPYLVALQAEHRPPDA